MPERVSEDKSTWILNLRRHNLRKVMGLLKGHCTLRKHMHRMRIFTGNPHCKLCGLEEETA
jgi:hypothetical protein